METPADKPLDWPLRRVPPQRRVPLVAVVFIGLGILLIVALSIPSLVGGHGMSHDDNLEEMRRSSDQ